MKLNKLPISLLEFQDRLVVKKEKEQTEIWDPIRKKYLLLQPEEWVRQLLITYFITEKIYPKGAIQVEKAFTINGIQKRFDIVIYTKAPLPFLLIECKSPNVKVNQITFDQVAGYNTHIKAPYLMVSNGLDNYCFSTDHASQKFLFHKQLPPLL